MSEEEVKTPEEEKVAAAATPKDAAPRDATPKDAAPKDAAPKDAAPKDATPKDAAPKDAATPEESAAEPEKKEVTAEDLLKSDLDGVKIRRAKGSKNITSGVVNVLATFNNTKVTFTDPGGNVISWSSAGKCNFRGSRKSTAYAAQVVTQDAGRVAMSHGMKEVVVKLKGPGMGRDSAVRALQSLGMIVTEIVDVTPVPHNGCRSPKRRRV